MMPQRGFKGGMTSIKEQNNTNVAKMKENELFEFSKNDVQNQRLSATAQTQIGAKIGDSNQDQNSIRSAQKNLLEEFKKQQHTGNRELDDSVEQIAKNQLFERTILGINKEVSFFPFNQDRPNSQNSHSEQLKPNDCN